ncbi:hypothetical protein [Dysgonomonas sp.]
MCLLLFDFLTPNQVIGENKNEYYQPQGIALVFHPDLIAGTSLGKTQAIISISLILAMKLRI